MTTRIVVTVFALLAMLSGIAAGGTPEENKDIVEQCIAATNAREYDLMPKLVAEDLVRHCQATPDVIVRSLDDFRAFLIKDATAFPDSRIEIQQMVAEGDRVAIWATYSGTQKGSLGPFPPSDKRLNLDISGVFRIEDGKVAEIWMTWDNLATLTQLGHFPPRGAGKGK